MRDGGKLLNFWAKYGIIYIAKARAAFAYLFDREVMI
jgi:hypothetical protein